MKRTLLLLMICLGLVPSAAFAQDGSDTEDLTDYKTACLAAIDNISKIGDNATMRSMTSLAKSSLDICQTKDAMRSAMTALRTGVVGYLQTAKRFSEGQVFTGLVGNHSFDTGDLSLWYSVEFDLSQVSLTDLTNAMNGGDVSGLVNAVTVNNWNEDTKAVENAGSSAIQGGAGKYYLNSKQLIAQPIIGLPAGLYSFSASVACNPGFLKLNKVHLNALVIPKSVVQEVISDVIGSDAIGSSTNWEELLSSIDLQQYMGLFLQSGKLYTEPTTTKSLSTFSYAELRFNIEDGDIVLIGLNAGMMPYIGTDQYRADNLQLIGVEDADGISLTPAPTDAEEATYNLAGQQIVSRKSSNGGLPRGIYIRNGKKIAVN